MFRSHKSLHKDKNQVLDYWNKSANRMLKAGQFAHLKDQMIFDHTWITTVKAFIKEGNIRDFDHILDVGCGWGRVISGIKYFCPNTIITGIDANQVRLDVASNTLDQLELKNDVTLQLGDADRLDFPDNSFDIVTSARLLQYVVNPINTIHEFCRVVKPGGHIVITVPNKFNPIRLLTYTRILYSPLTVKSWFYKNNLLKVSCRTIGFIPNYKRLQWRSKWLAIETLQNVPVCNLLGGLVLCSGVKGL